jgi:hypothetical protein
MTILPFQGLNTKLKIFHNSCNSPATPGKGTGDTFSNCFYDFFTHTVEPFLSRDVFSSKENRFMMLG